MHAGLCDLTASVTARLLDSVADVHDLRDAGYDMAGNWYLGMALEHLTKTMKMSVEGAPFRLPFFMRPIARWILFRTALEGGTTRLPLPTNKHLRPTGDADIDGEIATCEAVVGQVMDRSIARTVARRLSFAPQI